MLSNPGDTIKYGLNGGIVYQQTTLQNGCQLTKNRVQVNFFPDAICKGMVYRNEVIYAFVVVPYVFSLIMVIDANSSNPLSYIDMVDGTDYNNMKIRASDNYTCVCYGINVNVYVTSFVRGYGELVCSLSFVNEIFDI